jgi:hypothetical protein
MKVTEIIQESQVQLSENFLIDLFKGLFKAGARGGVKTSVTEFIKGSSEGYARALLDAERAGLKPPGLVEFLDKQAKTASGGKQGWADMDPSYTTREVLDQIDSNARKILPDLRKGEPAAAKTKVDDPVKTGMWQKFKDTPTWKKLWLGISYGGPVLNGLDALFLRPFLEYKQNMDNVKGWVESGQRPVGADGQYLDVVDGKQLTPQEWVEYMNHSQARAAYIKTVATLQTTWLDAKALAHMSGGFQDLATLGLIAYFANKIPGVKTFEKYIGAPALLALMSSLAQHNADKLAGIPPNALAAVASLLNINAIKDTVDGGADYLLHPVDSAKETVNKLIDWLIGLVKNNKPQQPTQQPTAQQQPAQQPVPSTTPDTPPETTSGYPNMIPNLRESTEFWTRNYNGTKIKNPATGLWESYKR